MHMLKMGVGDSISGYAKHARAEAGSSFTSGEEPFAELFGILETKGAQRSHIDPYLVPSMEKILEGLRGSTHEIPTRGRGGFAGGAMFGVGVSHALDAKLSRKPRLQMLEAMDEVFDKVPLLRKILDRGNAFDMGEYPQEYGQTNAAAYWDKPFTAPRGRIVLTPSTVDRVNRGEDPIGGSPFHPPGTGGIRGLVAHEGGHAFEDLVKSIYEAERYDPDRLYPRLKGFEDLTFRGAPISEYPLQRYRTHGRRSGFAENWAETFAATTVGRDPFPGEVSFHHAAFGPWTYDEKKYWEELNKTGRGYGGYWGKEPDYMPSRFPGAWSAPFKRMALPAGYEDLEGTLPSMPRARDPWLAQNPLTRHRELTDHMLETIKIVNTRRRAFGGPADRGDPIILSAFLRESGEDALERWMTRGYGKSPAIGRQASDILPWQARLNRDFIGTPEVPTYRADLLRRRGPQPHAAGGREDGNGTYLVGELAPELFVPDRMRYIIPENVMDKIPKRGGGGRAKPAFLGALIGPLMGALGGAMGGMAGLASMAGGALQQVAGSVMGSLFGGQNADYGGFAKGGHIRKMGGGVIEVGSRGPHLFTPPEDGWIVPHNLTGQVSPNIPRAVAGVGIRLSKAERDALKVRRNQKADPEDIRDWTEEQGDILNMVAEGNIGAIQALSGRNTKSWLASMATSGTRQGFMQRQHAAQISIGEARRTARREAPTILLGQDAERRRADAETALTRMTARRSELETKRASMEARGATAMVTPAGNATEYAKTVRTIGALTSGMEKANKVIGAHTKVVDEGRASLVKVNEANQTAAQLSKQAQPGAVAKAGMGGQVFAANIAYQVAMQAFSAVISAATPQAEKWVDSVTGFTATNQRVTKKIGESVRQTGGNLQTAMGQLALSSGLSGGAMEFLKGALGGASFAKAGAAAQTEKSDLFKAAANGNAPTGLVGGYGGLFGTGILGEFMGGGKGYAEQMGLDIKDFAGKAATAELVAGGPNGMTTPASGYGSMDWMSGTFGPAFVAQMKENVVASGGSITQAPRNPEQEKAFKALTEYTNDFNESLKRGATAAGEVAYTFTKVGEAIDPKDLEAFKALGDEAKDMAAANQVLVNAQGEVVSTQKEFQAALAQGARGNAIGSPEAYAASQTMGIMGQFKGMAAQIGHALAISIPAQFGQQLAAQPFLAAQTGVYSPGAEKTLAGSSKVVGDLLAGAKVIQDELTAAGDQAVEAQAKWIDEQATFNPELQAKPAAAYHRYEGKALPDGDRVMGGGAIKSVADQYREAMASVKESGIAIAKYQTLIADTQLKVAEKSYANNLRLSNRAVSDARGLAGLTGGANNLGAVQRQQTMLGFGMQQKQINFSVAMAGFQAPGLTSEERGARQEQAKIEAAYAQKQLNLSKQAFGIEAGRGVTDTSASRAVMKAEWEAQKVTAAANKAIAAEQMKIAKNLAVAEKHVAHAEGTFAAIINSAVGYVSVFGSTIGQATTAIRTALGMTAVNTRTGRPLRGTGSASGHSATTEATGMIGSFSTPTTATFGEAGTETVAILRNPRQAMMGAMGGGYAAPAPTIVTLNLTVQGDVQGEAVVAKIVRAVEDSFNRKAARLGMRTYVSAAG
jgi:hypothetical protein